MVWHTHLTQGRYKTRANRHSHWEFQQTLCLLCLSKINKCKWLDCKNYEWKILCTPTSMSPQTLNKSSNNTRRNINSFCQQHWRGGGHGLRSRGVPRLFVVYRAEDRLTMNGLNDISWAAASQWVVGWCKYQKKCWYGQGSLKKDISKEEGHSAHIFERERSPNSTQIKWHLERRNFSPMPDI